MICENCLEQPATEKHHKFSQTKQNKKLYPNLIHHRDNIQYLCYNCHHCKSLLKWTEKEFCEHFNIIPRSKSGFEKYRRNDG